MSDVAPGTAGRPSPEPLLGESGPIARVWRGVVSADRVAAYAAYVDATGVGAYRQTPGNRSADILTRDLGDGTAELLAVSLWDDLDAIRRFAGDDITAMVLYDEDRDYLLVEPTLAHYAVHSTTTDLREGIRAMTTVAASDHNPERLPSRGEEADSGNNRNVAEAFSGHRFHETYDHLAPDIAWVAVGAGVTIGKDAVIAACENTLAELPDTSTLFQRFRSIADEQAAVVDSVGHYTGPDDSLSRVASCDIYEFRDGLVTRITSYTVEVDPTEQTGAQ